AAACPGRPLVSPSPMIRTKIVCTLGPASASGEVIEGLVRAGLDLARINMSHGSHDQHRKAAEHVRRAAVDAGRPVAILVDLAGPKIRVGELPHPFELRQGDVVVMAPEGRHREGEIPTTYPELARELRPGSQILLDDGLLELEAVDADRDRARLRVVRGGTLKSRKGINLPGVAVKAPSLTEKDLRDLDFALEIGAEFIGLSFVRRAADVADLKERVAGRSLVVAKIEKARALGAIEE